MYDMNNETDSLGLLGYSISFQMWLEVLISVPDFV